jgi:hypothetical protein
VLYAISWFLVLTLLIIWSTGVWLFHSLAVWSLIGVGAAGQSLQIDRLPDAGWMSLWVPPDLILAVQTTVAAVMPWVQSMLSALPSLADWLAPLAWIVWGAGLLTLAVGTVALHAMIAVARRAASQ